MNQANAVRVQGKVSVSYRDLWLSFYWPHTELYISVDYFGEAWAFREVPTNNGFKTFSCINDTVGILISKGVDICDWPNSVVKYTIK